MEVASGSSLKLYWQAFVKKGQTKAAVAFKVQKVELYNLWSDFAQILHAGSSQVPTETSVCSLLQKKAKQRLQRPLKSKKHNSAIYGPILLTFCMQVAQVSGQKL